MKKILVALVATAFMTVTFFACKKNYDGTSATSPTPTKTNKDNHRHARHYENLSSYFTAEETQYLSDNFGEFDLNTLHESISEGKTITTVSSKANDAKNIKILVLTEKDSNETVQVMKEVFTISSTTTQDLKEIFADSNYSNSSLERTIVCLNIGVMYTVNENDEIKEQQLGFNVEAYGSFASCFKSCWATRVRNLTKNLAAAIFCIACSEECALAISSECTWECLFG